MEALIIEVEEGIEKHPLRRSRGDAKGSMEH